MTRKGWKRLRIFLRGQWIYLVHVLGLLSPGHEVPLLPAHPIEPQPLNGWAEEDLQLMLDEGRRQGDRQLSTLEQIRGRAQWLFTFGTPLVAVVAAISTAIGEGDSGWWFVVWGISLALVGYGVIGAAAIMTVRADFDMIDTAVLSGYNPPVANALAADYASMLRVGENTVATRLTVFRQAVVWVIVGGYGALITWLAVG